MNNADKIIAAWNAQADEFNYWECLGAEEKLEFAFDYGLSVAAGRLNTLALDDNSIRHAVNIINECKVNQPQGE